MLPVILVLLGLFLAGFSIVTLQRGVGQIVAGCALLVLSVTAAVVPLADAAPGPAPTFTMDVSGR